MKGHFIPEMKERKIPSERDQKIYQKAKEDLLDFLYGGITGRFQIAGHRLISKWVQPYASGGFVLEIGSGHGHHLKYSKQEYKHYIGLDLESRFLSNLHHRYPEACLVNGDAYALPFRDKSMDCILAVYTFEHLRSLPRCLDEIHRILKPDGGLLVGLPAEGGLLYGLGRHLSSRPYMQRKYGIDYDAIVQWEHWNTCNECIAALHDKFKILKVRYIPFLIPSIHFNIILIMKLIPKYEA